ncbi:MAG: YfhO family protein, partial [Lachnospiraceae bacterium]|nr:YfhO family protein [Lachnospiraceae bacterium]
MKAMEVFYNRLKEKKYYVVLLYTIVYFLFLFVVFFISFGDGKTIVGGGDPVSENYTSLMSMSRVCKAFLTHVFKDSSVAIPMWNYGIGFGDDILTTMNFYGFADPVAIISVFFPENAMGMCFWLIYVIKTYVGGLAFMLFAKRHRAGDNGALLGSMVYVFSAYAICYGPTLLAFLTPVTYFPLMLLGTDELLDRKKPGLLIVSTALCAISNFYFLYMSGIAAAFYALFRYFTENRPYKIKDILLTVRNFALAYLCAALISAAVLLPVVAQMLTSTRHSSEHRINVFYSLVYYLKFVLGFICAETPKNWTMMGYGMASFLSVVVLFMTGKKYLRTKVAFIISSLCMLLPVGGFIMNGLGYPANRWSWVYCLIVSYTVSRMYDEFLSLSDTMLRVLFAAGMLALIYCILTPITRTGDNSVSIIAAGLILLIMIAFLCFIKNRKRLLFFTLLICILINSFTLSVYNIIGIGVRKGASSNYLSEGDLEYFRSNFGMNKMLEEDDSEYRVEQISEANEIRNLGVIDGVTRANMNFSLTGAQISKYLINNYIVCEHTFKYNGLNKRTALLALSSFKYLISGNRNLAERSPLYKSTGKSSTVRENPLIPAKERYLYEYTDQLPMGYAYDRKISYEDFLELSAAERQEVQLNAAVTDGSSVPDYTPDFRSKSIMRDYVMDPSIEGDLEDMSSRSSNSEITVSIDDFENSELYVVFKGIDFAGYSRRDCFTDEEWASLPISDRTLIGMDDLENGQIMSARVVAEYGDRSGEFKYVNKYYQYYCGQDDYLINLGYFENGGGELKITLKDAGRYHFDSIDVVVMPIEEISQRVDELKACVM